MSISPIFFLSFYFHFFIENHVTSRYPFPCLVFWLGLILFYPSFDKPLPENKTIFTATDNDTLLPTTCYYPLPTQPGPGYFPSLRGGRIGYHETSAAKPFRRQIGERKVKLITPVRNQHSKRTKRKENYSSLPSLSLSLFEKAERKTILPQHNRSHSLSLSLNYSPLLVVLLNLRFSFTVLFSCFPFVFIIPSFPDFLIGSFFLGMLVVVSSSFYPMGLEIDVGLLFWLDPLSSCLFQRELHLILKAR